MPSETPHKSRDALLGQQLEVKTTRFCRIEWLYLWKSNAPLDLKSSGSLWNRRFWPKSTRFLVTERTLNTGVLRNYHDTLSEKKRSSRNGGFVKKRNPVHEFALNLIYVFILCKFFWYVTYSVFHETVISWLVTVAVARTTYPRLTAFTMDTSAENISHGNAILSQRLEGSTKLAMESIQSHTWPLRGYHRILYLRMNLLLRGERLRRCATLFYKD